MSMTDNLLLIYAAGFGGGEDYFSGILSRVQAHLDASCTVTGTYMCQGKMPAAVRERYETMLLKEPETMQRMIDILTGPLPIPIPGICSG